MMVISTWNAFYAVCCCCCVSAGRPSTDCDSTANLVRGSGAKTFWQLETAICFFQRPLHVS